MDDSLLPVTSLRENLTQTHLDFSYFRTTEPKLTPALRKMPLTDLRHTIWTGEACQPQAKIWCEIHETKKEKAASLSQLTAFSYFTTCCTLAFSTSLPSTMVIPCL